MARQRLYRVTHREPLAPGGLPQKWCGPGAISAITGRSAECAAAWINHGRGNPLHHQTEGVRDTEMSVALSRLGYWMRQHIRFEQPVLENRTSGSSAQRFFFDRRVSREFRPTLAAWLRGRSLVDHDAVFLVCVSNHFLVVRGRRWADSGTDLGWIGKCRYRRSRVNRVYVVTPIEDEKSAAIRRKRTDPLP